MTQLEIAYQNLLETNRHNVVTESETHRHNIVSEGLTLRDLQERERHNRATEYLSYADLTERARHNRATESIQWTEVKVKAASKPWSLLLSQYDFGLSGFENLFGMTANESRGMATSLQPKNIAKAFDWIGDINVFIPQEYKNAKKQSGKSWAEFLVPGILNKASSIKSFDDLLDWGKKSAQNYYHNITN